MTIIVYRDGVLCSDSSISQGGAVVGTSKKIIKTKDGWLAGAAGNLSDITLFLNWVSGDREDLPEYENIGGILINPKGTVFSIDAKGIPNKVVAKYHAEGSGMEVALGALEMGATAEQATKIAIKLSVGCGGKIQKLTL